MLTGDQNQIKIGAVTNIQDRTVIHTVKSLPSGFPATTTIGNYVSIGKFLHGLLSLFRQWSPILRHVHTWSLYLCLCHPTIGQGSTLCSCTVMDEAVVGVGCILGEDSLVESHAMLEAGSVVPAGGRIPSGQVEQTILISEILAHGVSSV
jgi:carbonic anhydrase/acetyltransferase-like protein (isoleucine patch superfamily)